LHLSALRPFAVQVFDVTISRTSCISSFATCRRAARDSMTLCEARPHNARVRMLLHGLGSSAVSKNMRNFSIRFIARRLLFCSSDLLRLGLTGANDTYKGYADSTAYGKYMRTVT
jgi:hypothetical protein